MKKSELTPLEELQKLIRELQLTPWTTAPTNKELYKMITSLLETQTAQNSAIATLGEIVQKLLTNNLLILDAISGDELLKYKN